MRSKRGAAVLLLAAFLVGVGTILIDPREGDMAVYLAQLERLAALGARVALPAHGEPIDAPEALFRLGLSELALGQRAAGAEHLRQAGAADRAPRRGTAYSNGIVRQLAAADPSLILCDLEASIRARAPRGIASA